MPRRIPVEVVRFNEEETDKFPNLAENKKKSLYSNDYVFTVQGKLIKHSQEVYLEGTLETLLSMTQDFLAQYEHCFLDIETHYEYGDVISSTRFCGWREMTSGEKSEVKTLLKLQKARDAQIVAETKRTAIDKAKELLREAGELD